MHFASNSTFLVNTGKDLTAVDGLYLDFVAPTSCNVPFVTQ
jgi:hypothetical protein